MKKFVIALVVIIGCPLLPIIVNAQQKHSIKLEPSVQIVQVKVIVDSVQLKLAEPIAPKPITDLKLSPPPTIIDKPRETTIK